MPLNLLKLVPAQAPINGRYSELRPITPEGGGGYFSVIFRATHLEKQVPVALKFLVDHGDSYRRSSFEREGELLRRTLKGEESFVQLIEPPEVYVYKFHDPNAGEQSIDLPFLAFEWMQAGDLEQYCIAGTSRSELLRRLDFFQGALRATRRLHTLGCAHRDLKPSNFFVGRHLVVKLGDFGTAKLIAPGVPPVSSNYYAPPGDFRYTAPELLARIETAAEHQHKPDLYSLGAILFEMITGHLLSSYQIGALFDVHLFRLHLQTVPAAARLKVFHDFLDGAGARIPNLLEINPQLPRCVLPQLTRLIEMLCHFDYRERQSNYDRIQRQLRICRLVVHNEEKYQQMLRRRRARRARSRQ